MYSHLFTFRDEEKVVFFTMLQSLRMLRNLCDKDFEFSLYKFSKKMFNLLAPIQALPS